MTSKQLLATKIANGVTLMRRVHGWPQIELARVAGIAVPYISRLENGKNLPTIETIERLAKAFELTPRLFLEVCGLGYFTGVTNEQ